MYEFDDARVWATIPGSTKVVEVGSVAALIIARSDGGTMMIGDRAECFDMLQNDEDKKFTRSIEEAFR
jgi:hypothetical protein